MDTTVLEMAQRAKQASRQLGALNTATKNAALLAMAEALVANRAQIEDANAVDLAAGRENGLSETLIDRLTLNEARIRGMADGLQQVAALPDPVGQVLSGGRLANGLEMQKVRVPLGVVGIIYESRPNVTADAASLCLKAGNAVIL
ncbi:MAG: gamma-glutamyl phosphate reductase, partial [Chthonomonadales bacterium]|nr:gamma-glutamyl phosphate reductase [Chthonomonadales bacterium]